MREKTSYKLLKYLKKKNKKECKNKKNCKLKKNRDNTLSCKYNNS